MSITTSRHDVTWSYLGFGLSSGINLLILPLVLKKLSSSELGLWYAFLAVNQFVMLLDFGFMPTLLRNASYCWSGATSLIREGLPAPSGIPAAHPNYELLAALKDAARQIYGRIAIVALILLMTIGFPYVKVISAGLPATQVNTAWFVFAVGVMTNIAYAYWPVILRGIGAVTQSNKVLVFSRLIQLAVTIAGLYMGGSLVAVAAGFVAGGVATRFWARRSFWAHQSLHKHMSDQKEQLDQAKVRDAVSVIWYNAKRQGLASVGNGLIQRSGTLVSAMYLGLSVTASYGLVQQLYTMLTAFSAILFNAYLPALNGATLRGDLDAVRRYFSSAMVAAWALMLAGTACIACVGPWFLKLIGTQTPMLTLAQSIFMGLTLTLECTHLLSYSFLSTRNQIPSPHAFLITGLAVLGCSIVLTRLTPLGIWGILLAYAMAQLAHNNWRWPQKALKGCQMKPLTFLKQAGREGTRMLRVLLSGFMMSRQ